jgi:hypothetical protein
MPRIVYLAFSNGGLQGGHKMIFRHVETLRELGFEATCYIGAQNKVPDWFDHTAPVEVATPLRPDDIVVLPDDASPSLRQAASAGLRSVIFAQNPYNFAAKSFEAVDLFQTPPPFIAVAPRLAATVRRAYPGAAVEIVPCFADERLFRPGPSPQAAVAFAPRKRPLEAAATRNLFRKLHPSHAGLPWVELDGATEVQVAQAMAGSTLFLSLSRLESVGMTPLEAMASGCVCAGFAGVGGLEYATPDNGFWVPDDDCEAAADALARAADLVSAGGAPLRRHREAALETARQWSYATFRVALEAAWMRLAPDARRR